MKFLYRDNTEAWLKFIHSSVARTHDEEHACQGDDTNDDVILRIRKTVGKTAPTKQSKPHEPPDGLSLKI